MENFVAKHRNALLFCALMLTLAVSYFAHQREMAQQASTVSLPVVETMQPSSRLEEYRLRRDETALADMAALQALCDQEHLDAAIRADAARQLQQLVDNREKQLALEGALVQSGVFPCVAVVGGGGVTVVCGKENLSGGESALVLTLAKAHAGVEPQHVRVMTAENAP